MFEALERLFLSRKTGLGVLARCRNISHHGANRLDVGFLLSTVAAAGRVVDCEPGDPASRPCPATTCPRGSGSFHLSAPPFPALKLRGLNYIGPLKGKKPTLLCL